MKKKSKVAINTKIMKKLLIKCECPEEGAVPLEREHKYSKEEKSGMNHKPNI